MVKIFPKPHLLTFTMYGGDSFQDENGDWVTPTTATITVPCYAEIAGSQNKIPRQDGVLVEFGWTVYIENILAIPTDTEIVITNQMGEQLGKGKVLRFTNGQLGARLWV